MFGTFCVGASAYVQVCDSLYLLNVIEEQMSATSILERFKMSINTIVLFYANASVYITRGNQVIFLLHLAID